MALETQHKKLTRADNIKRYDTARYDTVRYETIRYDMIRCETRVGETILGIRYAYDTETIGEW